MRENGLTRMDQTEKYGKEHLDILIKNRK